MGHSESTIVLGTIEGNGGESYLTASSRIKSISHETYPSLCVLESHGNIGWESQAITRLSNLTITDSIHQVLLCSFVVCHHKRYTTSSLVCTCQVPSSRTCIQFSISEEVDVSSRKRPVLATLPSGCILCKGSCGEEITAVSNIPSCNLHCGWSERCSIYCSTCVGLNQRSKCNLLRLVLCGVLSNHIIITAGGKA